MEEERKIVTETVFREQSDHNPIRFGEIPFTPLPNDVILAGYDPGCFEGDDQWDAHYFLEVTRDRLENDEEYQERMEDEARTKKWLKERRYETYQKLKKEFEDIDKP